MKVRDLLEMEIDIDVYDNVCEEIGIAFCGPMELTPEGEKEFGKALNLDVEIVETGDYKVAIVDVDDKNAYFWRDKLNEAKALFYALAGYCSSKNFDKWFEEV